MAPVHPIILAKPHKSASSSPHPPATNGADMNPAPSALSVPTSATSSASPSPAPSLPQTSQGSSDDGSNPHTPPRTNSISIADAAEAENSTNAPSSSSPNGDSSSISPASQAEEDKQIIIEALKSKDRIYVLKLGEQMESLIKERRPRVDLNPASSYQRLLVHRCSAYYKLAPEADPVNKGISVLPTSESRIPEVRICELVPPESTSQPAFKIMRRSAAERNPRAKAHSQAGSVAGEDADLSDVEPSEAGSLGGRSNATGSSKKHMTIAEREAAYNEARSRIFHDFEEKEKAKESQMSANSSSLSLNSASATSANGDGSSLGEVEGSVSSPATESEWSGPARRDRRGNASASSSRGSVRGGSRNSRASSPSFAYPSLYEPAPTGQLYDPNAPATASKTTTPPYHGTQYYHPFAPPSQPAGGVYMHSYPYYPPYPYQAPPPDLHHAAGDPSRGMEQHYPPPAMGYGPYMWAAQAQPQTSPPAQQPMPTSPHHAHLAPAPHTMSPPPVPAQQYYAQPPYGYPAHPGYYPPPPGQQVMAPPPPPPGMQSPQYEAPRTITGPGTPINLSPNAMQPYPAHFSQNGRGNGHGTVQQHQHPRNPPRSNTGFSGNGKRGAPGGRAGGWSYGPGIGQGGYVASPGGVFPAGETVGPRLNTRRQSSNTSTSSSYSRASSINDDVSSIASSSTTSSSASRRTYTSTASSQHPLPPRPDWAVGLKAQSTLTGRETPGSRHSSLPISPSMSANGSSQSLSGKLPPLSLQHNDFPPLTPQGVPQEKRPSIGAWGNVAHNRSILSPPGGVLRSEDVVGLERSSPRGDGSPSGNTNLTEQLVNQIQSISIEEKIAAVELASTT